MVRFEALNALYGDCLLLRYGEAAEKIWLIDGRPKAERAFRRRLRRGMEGRSAGAPR